MRFIVFHAHNGFLEIWLELGFLGLALFALSYVRAWRKLWPVLGSGDIDRGIWMVFVLVLIALYDLDEITLSIYNGLFWVVYVATLAKIELLAVGDALSVAGARPFSQRERHGPRNRRMPEMRRVLVYGNELLPMSETLIAAQAGAMRRYDPWFAGLGRVTNGIALNRARVTVATENGSLRDRPLRRLYLTSGNALASIESCERWSAR